MPERLYRDLTNAVRALVATPVTTFATVLMLVVAVGANLAVFGLIDRAILTPARHVVRPDRLFTLAFAVPGNPGRGAGMTTTSYVAFDTIHEHVPALSQVAAWRAGPRRPQLWLASRRESNRCWYRAPTSRCSAQCRAWAG